MATAAAAFAPNLATTAGRKQAVQYLNRFGKTGANGEKDRLAFVSPTEEREELAEGGANTINPDVGVKQYYEDAGGSGRAGAANQGGGNNLGGGNRSGGNGGDGGNGSLGGGSASNNTGNSDPGTAAGRAFGGNVGSQLGGDVGSKVGAAVGNNGKIADNRSFMQRVGDFFRAAATPSPPTQDPGMNILMGGLGAVMPGLNAGLAFTRGMQAATGEPGTPPTDAQRAAAGQGQDNQGTAGGDLGGSSNTANGDSTGTDSGSSSGGATGADESGARLEDVRRPDRSLASQIDLSGMAQASDIFSQPPSTFVSRRRRSGVAF